MPAHQRDYPVPAGPLAWQCASLLLAYPRASPPRLKPSDRRAPRSRRRAAGREMLARTVEALRATRPDASRGRLRRNLRPATAIPERDPAQPIGLAGDPCNGGREMHRLRPGLPRRRLPATRRSGPRSPAGGARVRGDPVDPVAGRWLLVEYRVPIDALRVCPTECGSPYAHTISGVCETIPAATDPGSATERSGWRRPARPWKRFGRNRSR